ncbi:DUF4190 domain-containing protein [Microbispora sp. H13382]|uniref:DUF4190 domain-containing protein n=1 Tax=Microbispora sp. H13382 TaxID=2729112 RepID=UPI0016034EC2|nr:DUF4190 domain-containing protein [Microbispora sp. H13382]
MSNRYEHQPAQPPAYGGAPEDGMPPTGGHAPGMRNGLGVAALVLGIVGALTGLVPLLFFVAGTLGLLAVVFGFAGRSRARRGAASNGGVALAGAVLGLAAMGLATWGTVVFLGAADDAVTAIDDALSTDSPVTKATRSATPTPVALGSVAHEPPFTLKVLSATRERTLSDVIENYRAQGVFVVVKVQVKNIGENPATFDGMDSGLLDTDGRRYNVQDMVTIGQNADLYEEINPGQRTTRTLVFDIPAKATPQTIGMSGAQGSDGVFLSVR